VFIVHNLLPLHPTPLRAQVSAALKKQGGEEAFHWTTHPWLITQMYANATGNVSRAQMDVLTAAIEDGAISWHAGPMNLQAETAEPALYAYGLSLADQLDARFKKVGRHPHHLALPPLHSPPLHIVRVEPTLGTLTQPKKTGMNQKDVPGSTIGMVPLAAKAGVQSLHVGVNDFSTPPAVPRTTPEMYEPCHTFLWRDPAGATAVDNRISSPDEMVCFWCSGYSQGYGAHAGLVPEMQVDLDKFGSNHSLVYLMTVDNSGPQEVDEVRELARIYHRSSYLWTVFRSNPYQLTDRYSDIPPAPDR
jgi:hypothetical protein